MTIYLLSYSESAYSITLYVYIYMSPSVSVASRRITLTKAASRPLFARVRRYAPQRDY